jgi:beta-lactamase superfamily II metal-dependent hydrolase
MILGGLATIASMIWHPLGELLAWFAWPFPALTNRLVTLFASLPGVVQYTGHISPVWLIGYYLALFSLTAFSSTLRDRPIMVSIRTQLSRAPAMLSLTGLIGLSLATLLVWNSLSRQPDGNLHLTLLNVNKGDALLLQAPGGGYLLINGGSSPTTLATRLGEVLSFPDRGLDWLIVAGNRYDQVAGLRDMPDILPVKGALISGSSKYAAYRNVLERLHAAQVTVEPLSIGSTLDLGAGATLEVISSGLNGATFMLAYGQARILLPVGLSPDEIPTLLSNPQVTQVTAVLLPDGGYPALNPHALLQHYDAQVVLLSCDPCTPVLEPDGALLPSLEGRTVLRTDVNGFIELVSDGATLWVQVEQNP